MRTARGLLIGVALVLVLAVTTSRVQAYRDRAYLHTNLYLPSGKFIEQTSLGYREVAADWVWFQAVQYFGGYAKNEHDLAYFNGLIDIVTDLDPHFDFAYIFGAVVMSQDMGDLERVDTLKQITKPHYFGAAAPTGTTIYFPAGSIVWNTGVDNVLGWKATVAGYPGTWKSMTITLEP